MKTRRLPLVIAFSLIALSVFAQWSELVPGIDYREFNIAGPNNVFVTRLDRDAADCVIESCLGQGKMVSGRETVSAMVHRYDGALGYWGEEWGGRYEIVAAVNGDFWDVTSGRPVSGHIMSGWYSKRFSDFTGGSGFVWQLDRDAFIGGCVNHRSNKNFVAYPATGQNQNIDAVNRERGSDELVLYAEHWDSNTGTDDSGVEVLVEMSRPTLIIPSPYYSSGIVKEVRIGRGSTRIPFKHVVLSAAGASATKLQNNVSVGDEIRISQEVTHYAQDCSSPGNGDWTKTYAAIGGGFVFLKDGAAQSTTNTDRHPRTAVALNDDYVFFMVCDGRSAQSIGMTYADMADFCLNQLGAADGINLDGGGSSAMWAGGEIKNVPSDGSERATYNGLMMVRVHEKTQSAAWNAGDEVVIEAGGAVRLGPGDQYGALSVLSESQSARIAEEPLNGVLARGARWWKVEYDGVGGWIREDALTAPATAARKWEIYQ